MDTEKIKEPNKRICDRGDCEKEAKHQTNPGCWHSDEHNEKLNNDVAEILKIKYDGWES